MLYNNDPNNTIMFNKNCTQLPYPQVSQSVFGRLGDSLGGSWESTWLGLWDGRALRTEHQIQKNAFHSLDKNHFIIRQMYFDFSPQQIRGIKGLSTDLPVGVNELSPPDRVEIHVSTILSWKRRNFYFLLYNLQTIEIAGQVVQHLQYKCSLGIKKFNFYRCKLLGNEHQHLKMFCFSWTFQSCLPCTYLSCLSTVYPLCANCRCWPLKYNPHPPRI